MDKTTINYTTTGGSEQHDLFGRTNGSTNWTPHVAARNLMDPDEIMKLEPADMLLMRSGKDPLILKKVAITTIASSPACSIPRESV